MTTNQKSLLRVFVLAVLVIALPVAAFAQVRRAAGPQDPPSAPVTVVNKAANPVPVTGNTTVTGTVNIGTMPPVTATAASPLPVTATSPLPVAGTISVSNTPSVTISGTPAVTISGTPNVGISGTPPVTISGTASVQVNNGPLNPVPVQLTNGAAHQPVQRMTSQLVPPLGTGISLMYIVPAGNRLVIEYVSVDSTCGLLGGQISAGIRVFRPGGGGPDLVIVKHFIPLTQGPPLGSLTDRNVGGQTVRIYAEPGDKVEAYVYFGGAGAFGLDYTMAFSGHLEPI